MFMFARGTLSLYFCRIQVSALMMMRRRDRDIKIPGDSPRLSRILNHREIVEEVIKCLIHKFRYHRFRPPSLYMVKACYHA